jgi:hypothetical protein
LPQLALEIALVKLARLEDLQSLDEAIRLLREIERGTQALPAASPHQAPLPARQVAPGVLPAGRGIPTGPLAEKKTALPLEMKHPETAPHAASTPPSAPLAVPEPAVPSNQPVQVIPPVHAAPVAEQQFNFAHLRSLWEQILIEFRQRSPELQAFMKNAAILEGERGVVQICFQSDFPFRQMSGSRRLQILEQLIHEVSGSPWKVRTELQKHSESAPGSPPPAGARNGGDPSLRDNPLVKKSLELFRGRIV